MPNLRNIVCSINDAIKATPFKESPFSECKFFLIAYNREREDKDGWVQQPMIVGDDDNCTYVGVDDIYPLQIYHKIETPEYELNQKTDFGGPGTWIEAKYNMKMVCIGDRSKLLKEQEDILDAVVYYFPREFSNTFLSSIGLTDCTIDVGSVNINMEDVFSQEFKNVDFPLKTNMFMFSVKYTILMTYSGNCFKLCTTNNFN